MTPESRTLLFTLLAPVTVPGYLIFLALSSLFGGAYYIVVEASLSRLLRRPISLSPKQIAIFAAPVVLLAPIALAVHLMLFSFKTIFTFLCWVGRWQADIRRNWIAATAGLAWSLLIVWITLTCLNAAMGAALIGRPIDQSNADALVEFGLRPKSLDQMPPFMQAKRRELIKELDSLRDGATPEWRDFVDALRDDDVQTTWIPFMTLRRMAGLPWFYVPKEFSRDGLDRSELLLGPLLFAWLVLLRWPGTFAALRRRWLRVGWFVVRLAVAGGAIYGLVQWEPVTPYLTFRFEGASAANKDVPMPLVYRVLSPAAWMGADYSDWVRPAWVLFNIALWMIIAAAVILIWWLAWRIAPFLGWPRYYVSFLSARLLQRKRIAFFSVGAVTLCVAMMIIVKSVMGGFVDSIRDRANGLLGDLVMDGSLQGFPYYEEFLKELKDLRDEKTGKPVVVAATPIMHTYGVLQFPNTNETFAVTIRGIRLDEYARVNRFGEDLFYNERYGSTRLDVERGQPVFGRGPSGRVALPEEMDRYYYDVFLPSLPKPEREEYEKRYTRAVDETFFPGPGMFEASSAPDWKPQYEGAPYYGVILGRDLILDRLPSGEFDRDKGYPLGEPAFVTMLALSRSGDVLKEPPPKVLFRYVDDSRTGIHEIDDKSVYIDFDRAQALLQMGPAERTDGTMASARCAQIQIKLQDEFAKPDKTLQKYKKQIADVWHRVAERVQADDYERKLMYRVSFRTWEEMQASYIGAIQKEEFLVLIMFGVISLVAIFLILCIFYMIVQEKTRDVGIIKSVGGSTEGIAAVFLVYGAAIGLVGCIIGSVIGTTFVTYINDVQDFLARLNPGMRIWNPETYSFDQIPNHWKLGEVLWISALAIVASILGAAVPAIKAGRTWPVESLRYE